YEEFEMEDNLELLIIAYGSVSLAAKEAIKELRKEGVKVGLFRPITLWPSPEEKLAELGEKYKTILVAEMNKGQYLQEIQRAMGRKDLHTLLKANGRPISPTEFKRKIKEILGK
ncbi:MAG: transketolase C-terminal domain-containing protein, partial [Campylobacterales bacterium]